MQALEIYVNSLHSVVWWSCNAFLLMLSSLTLTHIFPLYFADTELPKTLNEPWKQKNGKAGLLAVGKTHETLLFPDGTFEGAGLAGAKGTSASVSTGTTAQTNGGNAQKRSASTWDCTVWPLKTAVHPDFSSSVWHPDSLLRDSFYFKKERKKGSW